MSASTRVCDGCLGHRTEKSFAGQARCASCRRKADALVKMNAPGAQVGYRERKAQAARIKTIESYGITVDDHAAMLAAQGGVCAICGKPPAPGARPLNIDHCHTTGEVRGLLCTPCNSALGQMEDDVARLRAAADYLVAAQSRRTTRTGADMCADVG